MAQYTLYHNPRCSKSRATLALIQERGIEAVIVEYLKTPPSVDTLGEIVAKLGIEPIALVRTKEALAKELGIERLDGAAILETLHRHPSLIERPILVHGGSARIGRPPEAVLDLLESAAP